MTRWNLSISDDTDRAVRTFLARSGLKKGDLSKFVDDAFRSRVFQLTVEGIKKRNATADQEKLTKLIEEAVEWARAGSS